MRAASETSWLSGHLGGRSWVGEGSGPVTGKPRLLASREEVRAVLLALRGTSRLIGVLLHGAGLRLLEGAWLRVKDVDFAANQIVVRSGKGDRDRVTLLPASVQSALQRHLERVRVQH